MPDKIEKSRSATRAACWGRSLATRRSAGFADSRGASIKTIAQSLVRGWEVITVKARAAFRGSTLFH